MSWLMDELTTMVLCWRVDRRDGTAVGLTSHDRDLIVDGFSYRAAPGMTPSAVKRSGGLDADTMDVAGAMTADAFREEDLLAGRWDGARVTLFAVDWSGGGGVVALGSGTIGAVETSDGAFTAELQGAAAALARPIVEGTSAECRAELGDRRCRVAMAGRRHFARMSAAEGRMLTMDAAEPSANAYGGGVLRWFGGANGGLESAVSASDGLTVTLRQPPVFAAAAGTLVELVEGCDKSFATCAGRFGNAANFRGEPFLPGIDLLTRYPGGVSRVEARARAALGARFRLHGRDPAFGLDCVGLVAWALDEDAIPSGYGVRGGDADAVAALLDARLTRAGGLAPGDVVLFAAGPAQLHLGVASDRGVIHADAGLRRVVERPGPPPWPVIGTWRVEER